MMRSLACLSAAGLISLSAVASAQVSAEPELEAAQISPEVEQARAHFQQGAALYKEGNFDAAFAEFTRAYDLAPNYRVLYNIGQVQVERHDYVAARRAFQEYLRQGGSDVPAERREAIERDIDNLQARISELRVKSNVAGAILSVDGVVVGMMPLDEPLLVSAGIRRLSVSKQGYTTVERVVSVAGGDRPEIVVDLAPAPGGVPQPAERSSPSAPPPRSSPGAGAWLSLVAVGAFGSGAVVFGLLAREQNENLDAELARFPADQKKVEDARSRLKLYAGLTDASAAAGGISAVLAAYYLFFANSEPEAKPAPRSTARLVPLGSGLAIRGEF